MSAHLARHALVVTCYTTSPCHNAPWWSSATALHGQEIELDSYDTDGSTLLKEVDTSYNLTCPPSGVSGTPGFGPGQLRSELDANNPVVARVIQPSHVNTYTYDGGTICSQQTVATTYDNYGRVTKEVTTVNGGTPGTVVKNTSYVWNNVVSSSSNNATGTYILVISTVTCRLGGSCMVSQYPLLVTLIKLVDRLPPPMLPKGSDHHDCPSRTHCL